MVMRIITYNGFPDREDIDSGPPRCKHGTDIGLFDCSICEAEEAEREANKKEEEEDAL